LGAIPHRGTLDGVDVDRMHKERMNEDLVQKQIAALTVQSQESQKQTKQILFIGKNFSL